MYFLSVFQDQREIVMRRPFSDFAEAIAACGDYYEPRAAGASLQFSVEVTGKIFRRATAQLTRPEDVPSEQANSPMAWRAAKQSNAFRFDYSYHFLVESDAGIEQAEQWLCDEEADAEYQHPSYSGLKVR
jgi:hypothetical protein